MRIPAARRSFALVATFALASTFAACSSSSDRDGTFEEDGGRSGSSGIGAGSSGSSIGQNSDGGGNTGGCSDAAKLVYVLSATYDLYSFNPATLAFVKIGPIDCPVQDDEVILDTPLGPQPAYANSPNSMAVDRNGTAYVGYQNGELFKVDTSNAKCTATAFDYASQPFTKYGMGFSANGAGSTQETLYLIGEKVEVDGFGDVSSEGKGLFSLNVGTFATDSVGDFAGDLRGVTGELTGGGDGKLYGFFTTSPAKSAEIDKTTAATSNEKTLDTVDLDAQAAAFAFSYWGGDFWFYTGINGAPSKVTRLRTSGTGSETTVVDDVGGFQIVGAGVSTCAPTSPVN